MIKTVRMIGDVHGKWARYSTLLDNSGDIDLTIQVGDFGIGFEENTKHPDNFSNGSPSAKLLNESLFMNKEDKHYFIRGNHDDPQACKSFPQYIEDGTTWEINDTKFMFIGGGFSIDREYRTEGIDWWADEELDYGQLNDLIYKYGMYKPDVMVTHDCPTDICFDHLFKGKLMEKRSRTGNALQCMFNDHKPKLWIFGHFHLHVNQNILGTRFICLEELQYMDLCIEEEN